MLPAWILFSNLMFVLEMEVGDAMCCNFPSLLMSVKCPVLSFHHTTVSSSACGVLSGRWVVKRRG